MKAERITRRDLILGAGALAAGLVLGERASGLAEVCERTRRRDRPNILFAIADDWSWPHAGAYGHALTKTPAFDRVAKEGVLFTSAFCAAPTCTASRGSILTGQAPHRLDHGANLHGSLPKRFQVYPDLLETAGYHVGFAGKGWGPGNYRVGGRRRNPAGPQFDTFEKFLAKRPADAPFCFWFGSTHPHRAYEQGIGARSGMKPEDVTVPPFLPDTPTVRSDLLDYFHAAQLYDAQVSELLETLDKAGLAENTLVIVTSDNGMPFPRGKCNLYDSGCRMPLAARWPARIAPGRTTDELVSLTDVAPTLLEAAGLEPPAEMTGRSFLDLLQGANSASREAVFLERERHTNRRERMLSYPMRATRTPDFLYIRNLRPNLWPAGDPMPEASDGGYGDIDGSPTKYILVKRKDDPEIAPFFRMACAKRPEEELYDLKKDPWQIKNVAGDPRYENTRRRLRAALDDWMAKTKDPRAKRDDDRWDRYPYLR